MSTNLKNLPTYFKTDLIYKYRGLTKAVTFKPHLTLSVMINALFRALYPCLSYFTQRKENWTHIMRGGDQTAIIRVYMTSFNIPYIPKRNLSEGTGYRPGHYRSAIIPHY